MNRLNPPYTDIVLLRSDMLGHSPLTVASSSPEEANIIRVIGFAPNGQFIDFEAPKRCFDSIDTAEQQDWLTEQLKQKQQK